MQNFQTTFLAEWGFWSLSTLYFSLTIATLFSSAIVRKLGEKICLFIGGATIIFYMLVNIKVYPWLLLVASAVIGVGAGKFIVQKKS